MVYLDSFIRGYCHECKKKSKCERDCNGLQEAVKYIIDSNLPTGNICKYCSENSIPAEESKCIDCRYYMYFTSRGDLHKIATGE